LLKFDFSRPAATDNYDNNDDDNGNAHDRSVTRKRHRDDVVGDTVDNAHDHSVNTKHDYNDDRTVRELRDAPCAPVVRVLLESGR
jgi:hypothetical protein